MPCDVIRYRAIFALLCRDSHPLAKKIPTMAAQMKPLRLLSRGGGEPKDPARVCSKGLHGKISQPKATAVGRCTFWGTRRVMQATMGLSGLTSRPKPCCR